MLDIEKKILNFLIEKHKQKAGERKLRASALAQGVKHLYFLYKYGYQPPKKVDALLMGTLFHEGAIPFLAKILQSNGLEVLDEFRLNYTLQIDNYPAWIISGQPDLVAAKGDELYIYDVKLAKSFTFKKTLEAIEKQEVNELLKDSYVAQLNVYNYLIYKKLGAEADKLYLIVFMKDGTRSLTREIPYFQQLEVPKIDVQIIENKLITIIKELEDIINNESELPQKCEDVWERSGVATKCLFYCEWSEVCEMYEVANNQYKNYLENKKKKKPF